MPTYWTLDADHNPVPTNDVLEWGRFFEKADRIVAQTEVGDVRISTVFLGIDHSFFRKPEDAPILFETMIFGGEHNDYQVRCATWEEAEHDHAAACAIVRSSLST